MSLSEELEGFRAARGRTLDMVTGLSQRQMDFAPRPGRWSAGEVLDHLLLADGVYRREIRELIELKRAGRTPRLSRSMVELNARPAFVPKALLPVFEIPLTLFGALLPRAAREFAMRSRLFRARNPDAATPRPGRPADALREELLGSLEETEALFEADPDIDYSELVHSHPLLGVNNVVQIVRFMATHERRHQEQLAEVLGDERLPP